MGTQVHETNPVVELPAWLRLSFLVGLTAKELIAKCDWFIRAHDESYNRDLAALDMGDSETVALYAETNPLCCLVPAPAEQRPSEDIGIPLGLANWILRRQIAQAALPQQGLPLALRQQVKAMGLSFSEARAS